MNDNRNCLIDALKLIDNLQKCTEKQDTQDNTCIKPFLGNVGNIAYYNTRPVTFYSCDNTQLAFTYYLDNLPYLSNVFRIENITDSCVTVRLLSTQTDGTYTSTNETAIINTNCICAIRCLNDINLVL